MSLARKNIAAVQPYVAGKPIEETRRQLGLRKVIKLASNENPLGPSPKAVEAIRKAALLVNRYPDSNSYALKNKLASVLGVASSNIIPGNGSDELIDIIIKTFVEDDENIVTADVTFLEYEIIGSVYGRRVITVPLRYFRYDLDAIKRAVTNKTKLIFIANPNNPTGTYVSAGELENFLRGLPRHVIVVLDEAYDAFIDVDDFPSSTKYIRRNNVIVLKTFSKGYGLAGLRIGYAVARAGIVSYLERARQPFNVNLLAQQAACAALDDREFLRRTRSLILAGKQYVYTCLRDLGIAFVPTVSNFILIDTGRDSVEFFNKMLKYGVIVRDMKQYGLKNYIRVTIGTKQENERFINVLKKILSERRMR